jgi:hypothetical protein
MPRRKTKDKLKISNKNINHININLGNKNKSKNKKSNSSVIQKPLLKSNPILSHIPHLYVERQDPTIGNKLMNLESQVNTRLLGNIDDPRINYLENRLNNGENAFNRLLTNSLIFKSNNNPKPIIEEPPNPKKTRGPYKKKIKKDENKIDKEMTDTDNTITTTPIVYHTESFDQTPNKTGDVIEIRNPINEERTLQNIVNSQKPQMKYVLRTRKTNLNATSGNLPKRETKEKSILDFATPIKGSESPAWKP